MYPSTRENIYAELSTVYENLKAETLIAEVGENSEATFEDFVISNKGTFSRAYRRDVIEVDNTLNENLLTLSLSRNGLYDVLPEGLFHTPHVSKAGESYTKRRKIDKQEEQDARLFFAPLESEFFYQRLKIERNERALLDNFYSLKDDFLINFWNLDTDIPKRYILKLIKLLPHSYKIAGDLELTRLCLEKVLEEKVSFKKEQIRKSSTETIGDKKVSKDDFRLGVNSVLDGEDYELLRPKLEVTIGPVLPQNVNRYLERNGVSKFIDAFYDFFLPLELEAETKISVKNEVGFLLDDALSPIMGISTYL